MPIQVITNFEVNTSAPVDTRMGPFATVDQATGSISSIFRYVGQTVLITGSGTPVEYWFNPTIQDSDLVIKTAAGPLSLDGYLTTSSFNTYTGSNTSQFGGTASFASNATSASYVKLIQGPNIQINYTTLGIEITGSTGGGSGDGLDLLALPASNQIRLTSASLPIGNAITVPFATSASFLTTDITRIATASVIASVTPSQFSIVSGSTTEFIVTGTGMTLGSALTDIHNITGSVRITGSLDIRNSLTVTGSTFLRSTGSNSAGTGSNLVPDSTGWTGINWAGDNVTGFYRTTLNTNVLTGSGLSPLVVGETYLLSISQQGDTAPSESPVTVAIGDIGGVITLFSNGTSLFAFRATTTNATMSLAPSALWDGTASVALYRVTSSNSTVTILPTVGTIGTEFRPNPANSSTNLAIGNQAGQKLVSTATAIANTYVGQEAGASNGIAGTQTFIGYRAGQWSTGDGNTYIGFHAGVRNTTGTGNTYVGSGAGANEFTATSGSNNVGIGLNALRVANGGSNTAVGFGALSSLTSGIQNVAIGTSAGGGMTSASYNIVVGHGAAARSVGGNFNVYLGYDAGGNGTTGNVYVGSQPGISHRGSSAIFIGPSAGYLNQSSAGGIYIGRNAGYRDVSGSNNIIIGQLAGEQMQITAVSSSTVTGSAVAQINNVIIGEQAAQYMWSGSNNTVLGTNAARKYNTTTGGASGTVPTGSNINNSIYIGYLAGSPIFGAATDSQLSGSNEIVIGANQVGFGSNTTTIGNSSTARAYIYGTTIITGSNTSSSLLVGTSTDSGYRIYTLAGSGLSGSLNASDTLLVSRSLVTVTGSLTVTGSTFLRSTGSNSAGTGSNLVPNSTGWSGINWTGDNATGFYRTVIDTNVISCSAVPPLVVGETYIATIRSTSASIGTAVALTVGDIGTVLGSLYSQNIPYQTSFRATTTNATMSIVPLNTFSGIWNGTASVELYRVTSSNATVTILPTAGTTGVEFRPSPGNTSTNLAIGTQAGQKLVSANPGVLISTGNTYIGQEAGASDGSGYNQTLLGYRAGLVNTGYQNTFLGAYAGDRNTLGNNNIFIGYLAGGTNNPSQLSSGSLNIGIGTNALRFANSTANLGIGYNALANLVSGVGGNVAVGYNLGVVMTSGSYNTLVGYGAGNRIIGSTQNICLGFDAGGSGVGGGNTYIGTYSGYSHKGNNAIFIGQTAGFLNQPSAGGIYIGTNAGYRDVSGSNNILIGNYAGEQMQITAVSSSTVTQSTVAQTGNVIIGEQAAQYMWAGSSNTVLGTNAARKYNTTTGGASSTVPTGSNLNNSIYIGFGAGSPALGAATNSQLTGSNEIVIGANQVGFGSNTTTIGANSTSASYLYGDLIVTGTLGDVMVLPFERPLPSGKPTGSIALSGSGGTFEGMYVYNGTTWTKIGP